MIIYHSINSDSLRIRLQIILEIIIICIKISKFNNLIPNIRPNYVAILVKFYSIKQDNKIIYKIQKCINNLVTIGSCALGTRCQFAHGRQELRTNNQIVINQNQVMTNYTQPNMQQNYQGGNQIRVQHINPMITNYKTQLCKHFNPQTGQCKNGSACTFAHGEQELNQINPYLQNQYMQMRQQIKQQNSVTMQAEITQQILIMILTNMEAIFPGQKNILNLLKLGQEKAKQGDNQTASDIIKQIIHDEQRTKEEKNQYQFIYNNAQNHYNQKLKECNM